MQNPISRCPHPPTPIGAFFFRLTHYIFATHLIQTATAPYAVHLKVVCPLSDKKQHRLSAETPYLGTFLALAMRLLLQKLDPFSSIGRTYEVTVTHSVWDPNKP